MTQVILTAVGQICDALSLSDLYKYVCNSVECKSNCCDNFIVCSCVTSEIDIEQEEESDSTDACMELCMHMFNSASTFSTESIRDIEEE